MPGVCYRTCAVLVERSILIEFVTLYGCEVLGEMIRHGIAGLSGSRLPGETPGEHVKLSR